MADSSEQSIGGESEFSLESIERSEALLTDVRTGRTRPPRRRPPTSSAARLTTEQSSTQLLSQEVESLAATEGSSYNSSEDETFVERTPPRVWEQPKVSWMDELKAVQARKAASGSIRGAPRSVRSVPSSMSSPSVMESGSSREGAVTMQQTPCHLVVTQVSPQICDLVGATSSNGGSSTEKPVTEPTKGTSTTTTTTTPAATPKDHSGAQQAVTEPTPAEGSSGGRVGVILAILTLLTLAGAGGFMVLRNPERREYLRSLFRGRNVLVQYSRVRTNEEASLLMHPPGALSDSDDEMLI